MNALWSALIVGGMTLLGVAFSNLHHNKMLDKQFSNESREREKERFFALRRETYLKAAEELNAAQMYLGSLSGSEPSDMNVSEALKGFFSAATKLQLVAETDTALLVNDIVSGYGQLLMRLMTALIPFQKISIDHKIVDEQYQREIREVQRIIGSMQSLNESGKPDSEGFSALECSAEYHNQMANEYASRRNILAQNKVKTQFDFARLLVAEMQDLRSKQVSLLVAIREDLGLHSEIGQFERRFREQSDRLVAGLESFLQDASDQFGLKARTEAGD